MNYAARFNKIYEDVKDFEVRLERFVHNHRVITEHNATKQNFTLGENQFTDWTPEEYKAILGYVRGGVDENEERKVKVFDESAIADSVDWVKAGAVTPVKDQLHCGSCWAFSAIGALEGAHFVASGELLSFSEQQLIDCASGFVFRNKGCHGGDMFLAYMYFLKNFAMLESTYPYTSGTGDDSTDCLYSFSEATNVKLKIRLRPVENIMGHISQMKAAIQ